MRSATVERDDPAEDPVGKVDEQALAYTGNDSTLPFVGAGLIAFGGLAAGAALLLRHNRDHAEDGRA